jgi:hypothetical protein
MGRTAAFDPARLFAILREHDVDFIVIGGLAAAANDAGWPTNDADIVVHCSENTFVALANALTALDAEYDTPHVPPIRPERSLSAEA